MTALAAVGVGIPVLAAGTAVAFSALDRTDATLARAPLAELASRPQRPTTTAVSAVADDAWKDPAANAAVRVTEVASATEVAATSSPSPPPSPPPHDPVEVVRIQRLLLALGHDVGEVDGDLGPRTTAALATVQGAAGLEPDGRLDDRTRRALETASAAVVDQLPASVVVDLSEQVAIVHNSSGGQVAVLPVSTGAAGSETPVGTFAVFARLRVGQSASRADVHMDYFTVFDGDIGFHGIPWVGDRDARIATPLGEAPASLGCIRMADDHAAWLYTFLPDGATVVVQD